METHLPSPASDVQQQTLEGRVGAEADARGRTGAQPPSLRMHSLRCSGCRRSLGPWLAYLHEAIELKVVHRDITSSNILIDEDFDAKVSDFGLAKLLGAGKSHITTRVMGTFGYVAPEYANSGLLNEKSDIYSFGVVLLEAITGRDPVDYSCPANKVKMTLMRW
ncbi:uncharacterized protein A4U43_C09F9300 [Asparagus officinalis]|uniref:non-specific serine/threonine protein kinase n=1 Tax=Asparagus officinalis TaxID=4686 RepID=A0A5P1E6C7_ASPOF|nr:uncharacterized protein A4U43_C09F9300 [Asparagus officinalis]